MNLFEAVAKAKEYALENNFILVQILLPANIFLELKKQCLTIVDENDPFSYSGVPVKIDADLQKVRYVFEMQ